MVARMGSAHGRHLQRCHGIPRSEGRPGVRSRHPHHHHRRWTGERHQAQGPSWRERHDTVHRSMLRHDCRRSHLHPSRTLHPRLQIPRCRHHRQLLRGLPLQPPRRLHRHPLPHPLPQVFREGEARRIPLPRSHRLHTGAHLGRGRRQFGAAPGDCLGSGRTLRLCRQHLRRMGRELHLGILHPRPAVRHEDETLLLVQHFGSPARYGLHHRSEVCRHHVCRFGAHLVDCRARHCPHLA